MNANSPKNREIMSRYPFLQEILEQPIEPHASGKPVNALDELTIKVEKADGDLMFRQACNTGLGEASFFIGAKSREGQVAKQGGYLYAIGENGLVLKRLSWPRNRDEAQDVEGEVYGWQVLWAEKTGDTFSKPLHEKTEYLVWVSVTAWFESTKDLSDPFGKFLTRTAHVVVYVPPAQGFNKLQEDASVYENLYLNSGVLMRGHFRKDTDIITINGHLGELCRLFQDGVYFNGMKHILDEGKYRGASGQFGPVEVLCAEMCGYDRVMLQSSNAWVSFQLRPGAEGMYVLGMGGTLPRIRAMVNVVCKLWNENPENRKAFKPNKSVSVI